MILSRAVVVKTYAQSNGAGMKAAMIDGMTVNPRMPDGQPASPEAGEGSHES